MNRGKNKVSSNCVIVDDLSNLHEQFTTACATYHGIMNSYSLHRQSTQPGKQSVYRSLSAASTNAVPTSAVSSTTTVSPTNPAVLFTAPAAMVSAFAAAYVSNKITFFKTCRVFAKLLL